MNSEFRETLKGGGFRWTCKHGTRNESLDCTVYALTAVEIARLMTGNAASDIQSTSIEPDEFLESPSNNDNNNKPFTLSQILNEEREKQNCVNNNTNIIDMNNNTTSNTNTINMKKKRRL